MAKIVKVKDEKNLESKKKKVTYVGISIRITTDFSLKTVEARG